jgi:hypothetical protein
MTLLIILPPHPNKPLTIGVFVYVGIAVCGNDTFGGVEGTNKMQL